MEQIIRIVEEKQCTVELAYHFEDFTLTAMSDATNKSFRVMRIGLWNAREIKISSKWK